MEFKHESNRIYMGNEQGRAIAEVTFPEVKDGVVDINHTFVDESLRGQGIAGKLMKEAAEQLRKENKKVILTCPYAVGWFDKNKEYDDILEKK
ncbi:MAG: GNAT family N-acetyltransferase [Anaerocolumna aminovalerica]|jgi:predicted GNAT family acetyltransferase|uniref:GNAT family N-acetyltransferase n=1 Tax=Anaerocolumna aminovalerica TaxID=1527 RepID=UPI002913C02C|nr:GNAT family N-acetyltransferase [Anaerocolumna aminovalerica]MDU6263481.1 GNAT family N-acetyltransferase [Anaerocolumna aminovalerica]